MKVPLTVTLIFLYLVLMLSLDYRLRHPKRDISMEVKIPDTSKNDSVNYGSWEERQPISIDIGKGKNRRYSRHDCSIVTKVVMDSIHRIRDYNELLFNGDTIEIYTPKDSFLILYSQVANKLHIKPID